MRRVLLALAIAFIISARADSRVLLNTQEVAWTSGIGKECQSVCPAPLVFSSPFGTNAPAYSCRVNLDNGSTANGFQATHGQCTASANGQAVTSANFQCGCLAPSSIPGLDNSVGGSCANACTKNTFGGSGSALSGVCMPTSEMGQSNHMGSLDNGQCNYIDSGGSVTSTSAFSCICTFDQSSSTTG